MLVMPFVFVEMVVSRVEFGVTETEMRIENFLSEFVQPSLPLPLFELLFVALGVLLLWPREFDVESGTSSEGNSHPWHDFFELESGKIVSFLHFCRSTFHTYFIM